MIKTLMISAAVSALMVSGALAQADMSKQPAAKTDAAPHDTTKFIPAQGTDQWVFSKFKGTDVLSSMGSSDGQPGATSQLVQAMAGFDGGAGAPDSFDTVPLGADTSQQPML